MRAPLDHDRAVRNAAQGDPAALAALFDAHGAEVYAFCHRLLGTAEPAADATQDAFLAAAELAAEPGYDPARFRETLLATARIASLELLGSRGGAGRAGGTLSAATMRLRPQQRGALALVGLSGLSYAATARILEVHPGAVAPLLARARLRLRDEMHGTAAAAAAVRSPDCEEALPLLAGDADGELDATEAGWLHDHVADCESCPRTAAAMGEAAATYAAWSAAAPPSWLQASTLAEFESDHAVGAAVAAAPAAAAAAGHRRARAGAAAAGSRRPGLATAALGGALVIAAFALLVAVVAGPLRDGNGPAGPVGGPGGQTVQVAGAPVAVPDAGASARAARAARVAAAAGAERARRDAAARARAARGRADARVRAASARSRVSTRPTPRRTAATAPRRTAVTPRRRTSAPVVPRPTRRTTTARRPRRTTTTSTPAPAAAPGPSSGSADEPAATASTPAPSAPAAPTTTSRPTQSTAPLPAVAAPAAPNGNGRACGQGGCGPPPRCSPNGNCHKNKGRRGD